MDRTSLTDVFRTVALPDGTDPVEKGIVRGVDLTDGTLTVDVALGQLGESLAERIIEQIRGAAMAVDGIEHVRITSVPSPEKEITLDGVDAVLAVTSVKGGVGKTTVAVGLARTLAAAGFDVGLFDADIYGPNVPHVLPTAEGPVTTNDRGQPVPIPVHGIEVLSPGLVAGEAPTVRRGVIAYGALENLLSQGAWSELDVMIVDMPAGSDDVVGALLEHVVVDGAIFVTTPFVASLEDTDRSVRIFSEHDVDPVAGVVNMNTVACECCGNLTPLFDDAIDLELPSIHHLPFDHNLQYNPGGAAEGPFGPLASTVEAFLQERAIPTNAVDLRGQPTASAVRQLSSELASADSGTVVRGLVDDPSIHDPLSDDATAILDGIRVRSIPASGTLLEATRA